MDETELRRAKLKQILGAFRNDADAWAQFEQMRDQWREAAEQARQLLAQLDAERDLTLFSRGIRQADRLPEHMRRGSHQQFINGIARRASDDPQIAAARVLGAYSTPGSPQDAVRKIGDLIALVNEIRKSGHPAPGMAPLATSVFWALQDRGTWPPLHTSAEAPLRTLGWLDPSDDQGERYLAYRRVILELGGDVLETAHGLRWLNRGHFAGLDPGLRVRCTQATEILRRAQELGDYPSDPDDATVARRLAVGMLGELSILATAIQDRVAEAIGRPVSVAKVTQKIAFEKDAPYRADAYALWTLPEGAFRAPSLRVWATKEGVAVGIYSFWNEVSRRAGERLQGRLPQGFDFFQIANHGSDDRIRPVGGDSQGTGALFVGRWYPGDAALDRVDFADEVVVIFDRLRSLLAEFLQGPADRASVSEGDPLIPLARRFREEKPYPADKDEWHKAERQKFAESLSPAELVSFDLPTFRAISSGSRYGSPGPQSVLNVSLSTATPAELERLSESIGHLLWGEEDDAQRIDRMLDPADRGLRGLGESVVMKLLAIAHPERYLPIYPYRGEQGKAAALKTLKIEPPGGSTPGQLQIRANDALRERLEPFFPEDPWAQAQFCYWLAAREDKPDEDRDVLGELADELFVDREFLEEIVDLLRDKGQVIFYGPPGTGKTYLARKLAEALAPARSRRAIVQFHPSMSYEDFFEGYRPELGPDGQLSYRLVRGPLALLADRAESTPGVDHVMVIDEINRANLPKVLGELLFLLEYREESVRTLYRPEEAFELPSNLFFIGTMNTADRSIALVDAALRRRFHFVPFFPHEGAMAELLRRWLTHHGEPTWVAGLVDYVNEELQDRLGGPHLQIGPSHFLRRGLNEREVQRIWTYSVFPFIEEQLFGELAEIDRYRFDRILARFRREAGEEEAPSASPEAEES